MIPFNVKVGEDLPIRRVLASLVFDERTSLKFLDKAGQYGLASTKERFTTKVGPDGSTWERTVREKIGAVGRGTLDYTGKLKNSFTYGLVGTSAVEWGTNDWHAIPLHEGATISAVYADFLRFSIPGVAGSFKKKTVVLPARPILGVNEQDSDALLAILESVMIEGVQQ